ncbi:MAG: DMT family transporter [Candidatus Phaeomarinobacter sp.]
MTPPHLILILLICLAWGFNFVVAKVGVEEVSPMMLTGARFALLTLALIPFLKIVPGQMWRIFVVAMTMGGIHFALMFAALDISDTVSVVAIGVQLNVPFATLLSVFILHEAVGWRRWAGMGVAFAGVVLISFDPAVFNSLGGMGLVILAAFMAAIGMVTMRQLAGVGVFTLQAWIAIFSWPPMFLLTALIEPHEFAATLDASWLAWSAIHYTAVGASLFGHAAMYYLLQRYEVSLISPITLLAPVIGVFFGVTLWGDELSWRMVVGGMMTLAGVLAIALRKPPAPAAEA